MRTGQQLLAATSITLCLAVNACSDADSLPEKDQASSTASSTESGDQPTPASAPCPGPDQRPTGKIAYSHLDDDGDWSLWLMDPDGSNPVCLLDTPEADVAPAWSPDGSQLVFNGGDDIYIAEADGSNITLLLPGGGGPAWSPDGRTILFTASEDGREEPEIMTVDTDGGGLRTLIRSGDRFPYVEAPDWSPDGRNILFLAADPGGWRDVYLMRADGSDVRLLLRRGFDLDGSGIGWSPDGKRIAFQADRDGGCIFTVNANGKGVRRLVEGCSEGVHLTWSPDSRTILWGPSDNGPGDLYSVRSSGGPTSVVEDTSTAAWPAWQPS
jgi:TolB protein